MEPTEDEARATIDHLFAVAHIVIREVPAPEGATLVERVEAAKHTVQRRMGFVDHMLMSMSDWDGARPDEAQEAA